MAEGSRTGPRDGPPHRVALICDYAEENWASMDLVADMLLEGLRSEVPDEFAAEQVRPRMHLRFTRLPLIGSAGAAFNADRLVNRFVDYPRELR